MEPASYPEHRTRRLLGFVGLLYLTRLVGAALVALPLAAAVRTTGIGQQPTGDAVLFAPGATYLFETLSLATPAMSGALSVSSALLVIAILLQMVPQGAAIHGLAAPTVSLATALQRSFASFTRFLLFGGLGFLAQAGATVLGLVTAQGLRRTVGGVQRAGSGELAFLFALALCVLVVCAIGALVDLARCGHARSPASLTTGGKRALRALLRHPVQCFATMVAPTLGVLALAVLTGFIVGALHIERGDTWRWLSILALHQVVIFAACVAEVYWLSRADHAVRATLVDEF